MIRALSAAVLAGLLALPTLAAETKYKLDGENTKVEFTGTKKGGKHDGGFKKVSGTASTVSASRALRIALGSRFSSRGSSRSAAGL